MVLLAVRKKNHPKSRKKKRLKLIGNVKEIFKNPYHPYTLGLLKCIPKIHSKVIHEKLEEIKGFLPDLSKIENSCIFASRCKYSKDRCFSEEPDLLIAGQSRLVRCFYYKSLIDSENLSNIKEIEFQSGTVYRKSKEIILKVTDVKKYYRTRNGILRAVDGVSFNCLKGEVLGIVGESGCGKTTLARSIIGLVEIDGGKIEFSSRDISIPLQKRKRNLKQKIQMVFQNPEATLNPQKTIAEIITRPLLLHKVVTKNEMRKRVIELLKLVKLSEEYLTRYPHEISGGEKQRIGIARALATNPELLILDEPISSLDVSVQAGIINLLIELQEIHNLSYIFIGHDLNVIRHLSNRIMVMYMGKICEIGKCNEIFDPPYHPYTEALLSAVPIVQTNVKQKKISLEGSVPSPIEAIAGCMFHSRCPRKIGNLCENTPTPELKISEEHFIWCHLPIETLKRVEPVFSYV